MNKSDVVNEILKDRLQQLPRRTKGLAFAPTNIALVKYWGKRDAELNLPRTDSFSVSLPDKGAMTTIELNEEPFDRIILNDEPLDPNSDFVIRTSDYLDLFRPDKQWHVKLDLKVNIPVAAGLASSACGFASLISALNDLFEWALTQRELSILARLGSGSAARSFWRGFVEWHAGVLANGMDSFAEPIDVEWSDLCLGLLTLSTAQKPISSRQAMQRTVDSSVLYQSWPKKVSQDLNMIKHALNGKNFSLLAGIAESNALNMHATMLSSWPPICYWLPETLIMINKVWDMRRTGIEVYFTEDAGPNLKLLFLKNSQSEVKQVFPDMEIVHLFEQ